MFERFTRRARRAMASAEEEATSLGHNFLGTEHILLGLLREREGVAAGVLGACGVSYDAAHRTVLALLGSDPEGVGLRDADALATIGIDLEAVRSSVEEAFGVGALDRSRLGRGRAGGPPKFAPRAKKVVELSLREALALGHNYIGTEHLLLAILRLGDGVAYVAINRLATERPGEIRNLVMQRLEQLGQGA